MISACLHERNETVPPAITLILLQLNGKSKNRTYLKCIAPLQKRFHSTIVRQKITQMHLNAICVLINERL